MLIFCIRPVRIDLATINYTISIFSKKHKGGGHFLFLIISFGPVQLAILQLQLVLRPYIYIYSLFDVAAKHRASIYSGNIYYFPLRISYCVVLSNTHSPNSTVQLMTIAELKCLKTFQISPLTMGSTYITDHARNGRLIPIQEYCNNTP